MEPTGQDRIGEEILKTVRQRQRDLSAEEHASGSFRICATLLPELAGCDLVMIYAPAFPEVSTNGLIQLLYRQGRRLIISRIGDGEAGLSLTYLHAAPAAAGGFLPDFSALETVVLPVPAFDRSGNRLGDGHGHYARFLETVPRATRIGLAFACQEVEAVPAGASDAAMDCIITEAEVIRIPRGHR